MSVLSLTPPVMTPVSFVSRDMLATMIRHRSFFAAAESLERHHAVLCSESLHALVLAVCQSYDTVQLNTADESLHGRQRLVAALVAAIDCRDKDERALFVNPNTALALAFHQQSRHAFLRWALDASPSVSDALFADTPYDDLDAERASAGAGFKRYQPMPEEHGGRVTGALLRDIYWGRDSGPACELYLQLDRPIYVGAWDNLRALRVALPSLVVETNPFEMGACLGEQRMRICAAAVARGLLRRENVSLCCRFFDDAWKRTNADWVAKGVLVSRSLGLDDWFQRRFCDHSLFDTYSTPRPAGLIECAAASEMIIFTLEPLRLPPYVLLEIVDHLLDRRLELGVCKSWHAQFITNVMRVYSAARRTREEHHRRRSLSIKL